MIYKIVFIKKFIEFYELFFIRCSGYQNYSYTPSNRDIKMINSFVEQFRQRFPLETINESFLFDYVAFQFMNREGQKTSMGEGVVMLNWVIGSKSLSLWETRFSGWDYHLRTFLERKGINKEKYLSKKKHIKLREFEELVKKRDYNTVKGFYYCIEETRMFSEKSKLCLSCLFSKDCIIVKNSKE